MKIHIDQAIDFLRAEGKYELRNCLGTRGEEVMNKIADLILLQANQHINLINFINSQCKQPFKLCNNCKLAHHIPLNNILHAVDCEHCGKTINITN